MENTQKKQGKTRELSMRDEYDRKWSLEVDEVDLQHLLACDYYIKRLLARNGLCLHILWRDPDMQVREEVVYRGYGLDKLIDDEDYFVRSAVNLKLNSLNCKNIEEWIEKYPEFLAGKTIDR